MKRYFAYLLVGVLASSGCVMNNKIEEATVAFSRSTLNELVGEYEANGKSRRGEIQVNLATLIFRKADLKVPFERVENVTVKLNAGNEIQCDAVAGGIVVGSRTFREGTDFNFKDGAIPLRAKVDDLGMGEPGALHLGLGYTDGKLLRLRSGDIVYREVGKAVGVVLIIPFAVMTEGDVVFRKVR